MSKTVEASTNLKSQQEEAYGSNRCGQQSESLQANTIPTDSELSAAGSASVSASAAIAVISSEEKQAILQNVLQALNSNISNKAPQDPDKIDSPINDLKYTLLMYATTWDSKLIKPLISINANPFVSRMYGDSALSIALEQGNEGLAKLFLSTKASQSHYLEELTSLSGAEFYTNFASHICKNNENGNTLRSILGITVEGAKVCFYEASNHYEKLGYDGTPLLYENDFI